MRKSVLALFVFSVLFLSSCVTNGNSGNKLYPVEVDGEGLHFRISHTSEYVNYNLYVYDVQDKTLNFTLRGYGDKTEYFYPFVQAGKKYEIHAVFTNENWDWDSRYESETITVTAEGGVGDSRIVHSGINYNKDRRISFRNYEMIVPGNKLNDWWKNNVVYYTSYPPAYNSIYEWGHVTWDFIESYDMYDGTLVLNDAAAEALSAKNKFWFKSYTYFTYGEENQLFEYEITSAPNYFEYDPSAASEDSDAEIYVSKDGCVTVESTNKGFKISKNMDSKYENIRVSVYDITDGRDCPSVCTDQNYTSSDYPFTQANHVYKVYIQGWDKNWQNYFQTEKLELTAKGGKGDFVFTYSSVDYDGNDKGDETVCRVVLKDFYMHNPLESECTDKICSGNIYVGDNSKWDRYDFNYGVIDIKNRLSFIRHQKFYLELQYHFNYGGFEYEYGFVGKQSGLYSDNHELPELKLSKDYQEISEYGEYAVTGDNANKKAFLITYNSSWESIGDVKAVSSSRSAAATGTEIDSDCILVDLPKGEVIADNSRAATNDPDYSSYKVGVTKRYFNGNEATLVSIHEHCNIWFYDNGSTYCSRFKSELNSGKYSYKDIGNYFDQYFEMTTYVFGSHVPKLQFSNVITVTEKTKIDLLIEDTSYTTPYGYYYSGHMYNNYSGSNQCEMVFIGVRSFLDYGYGAFNVTMHEFQHLLTDVNKKFSHVNGYYDHDYTEMMSTCCENILQTQYPQGIGNRDNGMVGGRISSYGFNGGYMVGISNWSQLDGRSGYSYGTNCAFIDFVMRYYGGIEVIRKIVQNDKFNRDAVLEGIRQMGYNETLDSLMMKFALCTVNSGLSVDKAAGGITAVKYVSTDADVYGKKVKFELMPLYYNWYSSATPSQMYSTSDRYERMHFGNYEQKGPAIIDNSKYYQFMFPKSFNIKYLGKNLNTVNIDNPGNEIMLAVAFIE